MPRCEGMAGRKLTMEPSRPPSVSVIIPTFNRKESLLRGLDSLCRQTYPAERFEVIVVDDGSSDDTSGAIKENQYPFELQYLRQSNQGATVARNNGAEHGQGAYLVFMDDDIVLAARTIETLMDALALHQQAVVLGALRLPSELAAKAPWAHSRDQRLSGQRTGRVVPFQECMTGLLAISRSDFFQLGMFQDPTGGWPNWDDVDFGYRASLRGFRFWRCASAIGEHWDYAASDLGAACQRWYRASKAAPRLFQRHPALKLSIPMFRDKGPIGWGEDGPALIGRKIARQIVSSPPVLWIMEASVRVLETHCPSPTILERLCRWTKSAYVYRGYREGLHELAEEGT